MAERAKLSILSRLGMIFAAAVMGFFAGWIALDASQTAGHYWPVHVVTGPIFTLAYRFAHEMHYGVLTFVGTGLLFAIYAWCITTFRSRATLLVIAAVHAALAVWGILTAPVST
jgi:hypothetical protein